MINRRKFLKTSLSSLALLSLPKISLAQNNYDVVVIGAGASGLDWENESWGIAVKAKVEIAAFKNFLLFIIFWKMYYKYAILQLLLSSQVYRLLKFYPIKIPKNRYLIIKIF